MLQIFRAGPSFSPKYFIIISEVSSSRALPALKELNSVQQSLPGAAAIYRQFRGSESSPHAARGLDQDRRCLK